MRVGTTRNSDEEPNGHVAHSIRTKSIHIQYANHPLARVFSVRIGQIRQFGVLQTWSLDVWLAGGALVHTVLGPGSICLQRLVLASQKRPGSLPVRGPEQVCGQRLWYVCPSCRPPLWETESRGQKQETAAFHAEVGSARRNLSASTNSPSMKSRSVGCGVASISQ